MAANDLRKPLSAASLTEFCSSVDTQLQRFQVERAKADVYDAADFNVFRYIEPDENRLSNIIHDLLDPGGSHGQRTLFLKLFLQTCGIPVAALQEPIRLKREDSNLYCRSFHRRIDITVEMKGFGI